MLCCALGTVILASLALWRKRLRGLFTGRVTARMVTAALCVIGLALAGLFMAGEHFGHAIASVKNSASSAPEIDQGPLCSTFNAKD